MTDVLADTSVWVAHFRKANPPLQALLAADRLLCHPLILIEIACGTPPAPRRRTLADLRLLRTPSIATVDETLALIEKERFHDSGCGAVDIALLASVLLTPGAVLWTIDRKLCSLARRLAVVFDSTPA